VDAVKVYKRYWCVVFFHSRITLNDAITTARDTRARYRLNKCFRFISTLVDRARASRLSYDGSQSSSSCLQQTCGYLDGSVEGSEDLDVSSVRSFAQLISIVTNTAIQASSGNAIVVGGGLQLV